MGVGRRWSPRRGMPWALASCPPPPFFFSLPPLCAPRCLLLCVFSCLGCPGPWRLVPPPSFCFGFFCPPPLLSPVFLAFRLPFASAPPPLFFILSFLSCCFFSCCASAVCVLGCRAVCSLSCPFVVLCASSVLFLVAGVVGSWCRCLLLGVRRWLWLPGGFVWLWCPCLVWPSLGVLPAVSRSPVLCPVARCCRVVLCCGALSSVFFFSPCWWPWFPVVPRWFWAPGRFRVVSVSVLCLCGAVLVCLCRCSLFGALLPSRDWLVFCVVACCVCVFAVGPGCPLLCPGGSCCRVLVACCGVSLGAVLRRVAARCAALRCVVVRCVVSFCSVWCCCALCCVLGRCPSSWGPVPSGAVFCLVPPRCVCFAVVCRCVVLFAVVLRAVCALGCRVVRFLASPPCAVLLCGPLSLGALLPCAVPRGAVLPRGAMVSCPAALLGLFLAWVWLYLLEKPLQNFVKYFFPLFSWLLKIK